MTSIASLFIKVDSKQVKKSTEEIKKLGKAADKAEKKAISLGKVFGTVLIAATVAKTFSAVIKNTIAQEQATAQLEATLKSTGNYTEELSKSLQSYASELQNLTTYGDEAIIASEGLLLTFRQIGGEVFKRAQLSVLDVATAMGTDLKSAAIQVGKALNDPATGMSALSRSGITFTDVQKDLVKGFLETNELAKAQDVILTELEAQFGGSAAAAKNTLGGAIKSLQNSFGDLLEGDKGSTGEVIDSINDLTTTLNSNEVKDAFQTLATGVFATVEVLANAITEIIQFDHWLGVLGKKYLGIDYGFVESATDSILRLNDEVQELQVELDDLIATGEGKSPDAYYLRSAIAAANDQLDIFREKQAEALSPSASPIIDFGSTDSAVEANKALISSLETAQKEAVKTAMSFDKMFDDITKTSRSAEDVTTIDIANVQLEAQTALREGDIDGAIEKAKEGFDLIKQMKDAGNLSDSLVEYYAEQFKQVGTQAGDFAIVQAEIQIEEDAIRQQAIKAGEIIQDTLDANPVVQVVELVWANGQSVPTAGQAVVPDTATQQAKDPVNSSPTIIKFGDTESPPVYGDQAAVDQWQNELAREATRRGTR